MVSHRTRTRIERLEQDAPAIAGGWDHSLPCERYVADGDEMDALQARLAGRRAAGERFNAVIRSIVDPQHAA